MASRMIRRRKRTAPENIHRAACIFKTMPWRLRPMTERRKTDYIGYFILMLF